MTQAGIAVLAGVVIGVGITYFFLQRTIRRQENALEQAMARLAQKDQDQNQQLNEAMAKMEADCERQLAETIERYQDSHSQQVQALEAEYETRMAALSGAVPDDSFVEPEPLEVSPQTPSADEFKVLPDPWAERSAAPESASVVAPAPAQPASVDMAIQSAVSLGAQAAMSRKAAIQAVPKLAKLVRDPNPDVRLAAVNALQQSGSIKAVPFLKQALKDSDSRVVAAANAALGRFKGAKISKPRKPRYRTKPKPWHNDR